jgi:gamma-glutamyltranspeptidase/glutathione hydrolase
MREPSPAKSAAPHRATPQRAKARRWWLRSLIAAALLTALLGVVAGLLVQRITRRFRATEPFPESATGLRSIAASSTAHQLVVAADPQAASAAQLILERGGSALDAAIAALAVLGLVEPQSAGLGGGAFLLYWDAQTHTLHAYDGRETAPAAVDKNLFMRDGQPLNFPRALVGGRSVGVPGALRMLALAHAQHGRLPWRAAFEDAVRLARDGFHVSARLSKLLATDPVLPTLAATRHAFFNTDGSVLGANTRATNPDYAATLEQIAEHGADAFYSGPIARDIARAVRSARQPSLTRSVWNLALAEFGFPMGGQADISAPGALSGADLAAYRAVERAPLCLRYRAYRVCSMPPPAAGVSVLQTLALLERFPLANYAPTSPEALHLLAEAQRVAFADRDAWLADPAFSDVPTDGLLSPEYIRARSAPITLQHALDEVHAGRPPGAHAQLPAARSPELPATTHFSIVDGAGNIASLTASIEFAFGSHVLVDGFLLNNQLTDFSFRPEQDGRAAANAVAAGKRPRSAMSPTLIFDAASGAPVAALGSPGGPAIVGYVVQTIVALLDWKLDPQAAVSLPHVIDRNRGIELEDVGWSNPTARDAALKALRARGHKVELGQQNSGLHVIWLGANKLQAGVDPRREGAAVGM